MNKLEFIDWLENKSRYSRESISGTYWRELVSYAEYIWDEIDVEEDYVTFSWEEWEWGAINYRKKEYSFVDFIYLYDNDGLKN